MESAFKELGEKASVLDFHPKSAVVGGGVEDIYGEDTATEDQLVTPWTYSVASGYSLLRDPQYNKGLAFTEKEREAHYLRGLLPPATCSQQLQEKKLMNTIRQYQVPLQKYMALTELQERNERLFYKLLIDNVEELLPIVYTPTVGEACQKFGSIFRRPQGLYISLKEKGKVLEVLKNWPERTVQVIVVTDGERILGLGDLGCQGMGIPVGKLALYTALGGVRPSACLPITIDVGTNNKQLLEDEFYIGLRQKRTTGKEYADLLDEFMSAVKQNYGEKVVIQFEDFANHNAFQLLEKYRRTHLVFNDDIQGTAAVVLAGVVAALRLVGGSLSEHKFLFLGAGEAGTGIAELIALEISQKTKTPVEETRKKIWLVDSKGLIVSSRKDSLQQFKKPWAHEHEPIDNLLDAVKAIKPTVLIGSSGVGRTFTKEVIEAVSSFNEKPLILALSNPTSQSECTAEEAYTWSKGRAIFASGQKQKAKREKVVNFAVCLDTMIKTVMLRSCPSSSPLLFEANREAFSARPSSPSSSSTTPKFASTICCSSRNHAYIPKLEPFSRSKLDRAIRDPPLIEKCENELSDYCSTLEGDESYGCWRAYFELKDLEKEIPKQDVEKLILQAGGVKTLVGCLHGIAGIKKDKKHGFNSAKPSDVVKEGERLCPIPDGLPKSAQELEEEESARMPDSPFTRLLRIKGRRHPAWYSATPDHETD